MTLRLYFDQHISGVVAGALRRHEIDVLTAEEDGHKAATDEDLLQRATALGRMLVTNDDDFLTLAAEWRAQGRAFAGIAFMTTQHIAVGRLIADLELIAQGYGSLDVVNHIEYLPL